MSSYLYEELHIWAEIEPMIHHIIWECMYCHKTDVRSDDWIPLNYVR